MNAPHPNVIRARQLRDDPNFNCHRKDEAVEMHGGICPDCHESTQAHDIEPNPAMTWKEYEARMIAMRVSA